ncbi:DUF2953 domain-containing protein [Clostridium sp. E02]|uniref:DUF2953 domain-containing protein n=1 Tax=Clostridium sp. E02 TaxID=2487134 RepID=UPI000F521B80|nr:DUF2953 domain-containing protein [Clostridium sp. E02]
MLPIILLLLKLLGLLILIVLGLLIAVILLVSFVPVRYRAEGSYMEMIKGDLCLSWLLHILSVKVSYADDVSIRIRLFGIRILKPKKIDEELKEAKEILVQTMEVKEPESVKEIRELKSDIKKEFKDQSKYQPSSDKEENKEKESWLKRIWNKIRKKIKTLLKKLRFISRKICDTLKQIKEKKEEIQSWITNKENQKTWKLFIRQGKKLLIHILPRKGTCNVTFGFEDPYYTGQVLMAAGLFYPFCHKYLNLYPAFDRTVFTIEGKLQGRIRLGTVLIIGIRMFFDRNFRVLLKKWLR